MKKVDTSWKLLPPSQGSILSSLPRWMYSARYLHALAVCFNLPRLPAFEKLLTGPAGDLSNWGWDDKEGGMGATCRPLGVEVYQLADEKTILDGWKTPECPAYKGMHGMTMPPRDQDGYVGL